MSEGQLDQITPPAGSGRRIAATVAGVVAAVAFGVATLGVAVVATIATLVAWAATRKRPSPLTRGVSWLIGVGSVATVLAIGLAIVVVQMPAGSMADFRRTMDSTATAPPPPPPEWLRRVTPPAAQAQSRATDRLMRTRAFGLWMIVVSGVLGAGFVAAITGSLGWGAAVLLLYGISGRWPPSAPPVGPPVSTVRPFGA